MPSLPFPSAAASYPRRAGASRCSRPTPPAWCVRTSPSLQRTSRRSLRAWLSCSPSWSCSACSCPALLLRFVRAIHSAARTRCSHSRLSVFFLDLFHLISYHVHIYIHTIRTYTSIDRCSISSCFSSLTSLSRHCPPIFPSRVLAHRIIVVPARPTPPHVVIT